MDDGGLAEFRANAAGARLTWKRFEDDLVRCVGPRTPVVAVGRTEYHKRWCADRGCDMGDSGVVPDENVGF